MNVLMVTFGATVTEYHYLICLVKEMKDIDITVAVPKEMGKENIDRIAECKNVKSVLEIDVPHNILYFFLKLINPGFYLQLYSLTKNRSFDVIHFVFEWKIPCIWVKYLSRNYPVVATIHEPHVNEPSLIWRLLLNHLKNLNCWFVAKFSTKVIVHGAKHKKMLISKGLNENKIDITPHGQFAFFNNNSKVEEQKGEILLFGKIAPYKGIEQFIQAIELVHNMIPYVKGVIAGAGDFASYKKLINKKDLFIVENRFVPDREVSEFFSRASIIVMPYTKGSQSGIISIAASFKKPVVATNVGHFSEMIIDGETGILVEPNNPKALAEAIEKLILDDNLRHKMGENAYKYMNDNFSWSCVAEKTYRIYEDVTKYWQELNNRFAKK